MMILYRRPYIGERLDEVSCSLYRHIIRIDRVERQRLKAEIVWILEDVALSYRC